ncbi:RNA polymerase sigma factor [Actinospongicola halichondriae]|uniref:RNA polymerase sigma factor n=1 Tax=Actinospongicola halichondriae TaxID=3236844 RepID=UPI003D3A3EA6
MDQETGFSSWYAMVEPRLRAALVARYGPERGRDAAAAALAWAWEHRDRLVTIENPVGYLFRVGQSKARRRRQGWLPAALVDDVTTVEPALGGAIAALPTCQRTIVVLVHGYGWSLAEVAELLDIAKSTVQTHLERGIARLRGHMGVE